MSDILSIPLPVWWAVAGILFLVLELSAPGLVLLFFSLGAFVTALSTLFFAPSFAAQLIIFGAASGLSLLLLRQQVKRIFVGDERDVDTPLYTPVGRTAVTETPFISGGQGRIRLRGSYWTAVSAHALTKGQTVTVVEDVHGDQTLLRIEPLAPGAQPPTE